MKQQTIDWTAQMKQMEQAIQQSDHKQMNIEDQLVEEISMLDKMTEIHCSIINELEDREFHLTNEISNMRNFLRNEGLLDMYDEFNMENIEDVIDEKTNYIAEYKEDPVITEYDFSKPYVLLQWKDIRINLVNSTVDEKFNSVMKVVK